MVGLKNIFIALCFSVLSFGIYGSPVQDNNYLMSEAVTNVFATQKESGIIGVVEAIESCYDDLSNSKLYCYYMDYTGRIFDTHMVEIFNQNGGDFEVQEYFNEEYFQGRAVQHIYQPQGSSIEEANSHMNYLYYRLLSLLSQQVD